MSILKVNTIQDKGGNNLLVSDGAGTISSGGLMTNTPSFFAYLSSSTNLSNSVITKVVFDTEVYDTDNAYDNTTGRFTVPSSKGGKYMISGSIWGLQNGGEGKLYLTALYAYKNGINTVYAHSDFNTTADDSSNNHAQSLNVILDLSAGDYVELYARIGAHSGTPSLQVTNISNWFSMYKMIGA